MKKHFYIFTLTLSLTVLFSQNTYSDSLSYCNYHQPTSLFLFTAGYRMPVNKNVIINSGHGIYLEGGINIGRLISKDLVIGIYAGYALMDRFWATSFNQKFSDNFNSNINKEQNYGKLDSSVISSCADLVKKAKGNDVELPGCTMRSFHNYSLYYGVIIRLPFKYVPIVKIYMGTTRTHFQGDAGIATKEGDFSIFEFKRAMYGGELVIFKGIHHLTKKKITTCSTKNIGALSVYYENCNFSNSYLYFYDGSNRTSIPLKKFMSTSFLNEFKNEATWGIKLSFYVM